MAYVAIVTTFPKMMAALIIGPKLSMMDVKDQIPER
jgi:hypothetical protein